MVDVERVDYVRVPVTDMEAEPEVDGEPFQASTAGIALRVPDVRAAVEEVSDAGGEVIGIEDTGVCHMGFVKDPDGNVLILHRPYAPKVRRAQG